jgi:hypothetical protein
VVDIVLVLLISHIVFHLLIVHKVVDIVLVLLISHIVFHLLILDKVVDIVLVLHPFHIFQLMDCMEHLEDILVWVVLHIGQLIDLGYQHYMLEKQNIYL